MLYYVKNYILQKWNDIRHSPYKYTFQDMLYIYLNRDGRSETPWEDF